MVFVNSGYYGYVTESAALLLCVCYIYQRKAVPYTPTALFTSNIKLAEWFNPSQSIKLHHCWLVKDLESYLPLLILKRSKAFTSTQEIKTIRLRKEKITRLEQVAIVPRIALKRAARPGIIKTLGFG